jgi:uncharacterized protein YciI
MNLLRTWVVLVVIASTQFLSGWIMAAEEPSNSPPTETHARKTSRFVILYRPGETWQKGHSIFEQPLMEHGKYMAKLLKEKKLVMAGPFSDSSGGMAVIEVDDEKEAADILQHDPAIVQKIFHGEIHPWFIVFDKNTAGAHGD